MRNLISCIILSGLYKKIIFPIQKKPEELTVTTNEEPSNSMNIASKKPNETQFDNEEGEMEFRDGFDTNEETANSDKCDHTADLEEWEDSNETEFIFKIPHHATNEAYCDVFDKDELSHFIESLGELKASVTNKPPECIEGEKTDQIVPKLHTPCKFPEVHWCQSNNKLKLRFEASEVVDYKIDIQGQVMKIL